MLVAIAVVGVLVQKGMGGGAGSGNQGNGKCAIDGSRTQVDLWPNNVGDVYVRVVNTGLVNTGTTPGQGWAILYVFDYYWNGVPEPQYWIQTDMVWHYVPGSSSPVQPNTEWIDWVGVSDDGTAGPQPPESWVLCVVSAQASNGNENMCGSEVEVGSIE